MVPFLIRTAAPSVVLLGAAAVAHWHDTYNSVTSQPDSPVINHPTFWTSLAPQLTNQNVAAGPFRLATIAVACLCAVVVRRRWRARLDDAATPRRGRAKRAFGHALADPNTQSARLGGSPWESQMLSSVLWWAALTLALRSFFEPVMVSYYPWPPMAAALVPAAALGWKRLVASGLLAGGLTGAAQGPSHAAWIWWAPLVAGLIVLLALARPWSAADSRQPANGAIDPDMDQVSSGPPDAYAAGVTTELDSAED
jgi:hypothetical protein